MLRFPNYEKIPLKNPPTYAEADETADLMTREDAAWLALQLAAEERDAASYVLAASGIDWEHQNARAFVDAVKWALAAGAHLKARELATQGAELFPDDPELVNIARILAPPKIIGRTPADPPIKLNRAWLARHRKQYRGKWVAIKEGKLVAFADEPAELKKKVGDLRGHLVTKVW